MIDYVHLRNLIQGEVIRAEERVPPELQNAVLEELYTFLKDESQRVLMVKLKVNDARQRRSGGV